MPARTRPGRNRALLRSRFCSSSCETPEQGGFPQGLIGNFYTAQPTILLRTTKGARIDWGPPAKRPSARRPALMPAFNVTRDEIDRMIEGAGIAIQAVR